MAASGLLHISNVHNTNGKLLNLAVVNTSSEGELIDAPFLMLPSDRHHKPLVLHLTAQRTMQGLDTADRDFDFSRCNYDAAITELRSHNEKEIFNETNINTVVASFYDEIFKIISKHTPFRRINLPRSRCYPWWNVDSIISKIQLSS